MKKYIITLNDKVYEVEMEEVIESIETTTITKGSGPDQEVEK